MCDTAKHLRLVAPEKKKKGSNLSASEIPGKTFLWADTSFFGHAEAFKEPARTSICDRSENFEHFGGDVRKKKKCSKLKAELARRERRSQEKIFIRVDTAFFENA